MNLLSIVNVVGYANWFIFLKIESMFF